MKWLIVIAISTAAAAQTAPTIELARDKHGKIIRSHKAKTEFRHANPCPATGRPRGSCPGYVIDHIKPLACGGADAPENMQWQTVADAKAKDRWERTNCGGHD